MAGSVTEVAVTVYSAVAPRQNEAGDGGYSILFGWLPV